MLKNKDIIEFLKAIAPEYLAHSWDNVGTLVGDEESGLKAVLVALELTDDVLEEAINLKTSLVITHHPLIFKPLNRITEDTLVGKRIIRLIKNDITLYSSHTNMDEANGGTNDALFEILELDNKEFLCKSDYEGYGIGRIGYLSKETSLKNFSNFIKGRLNLDKVNFVGDSNRMIKKVGLCTGAFYKEAFKEAVKNNCDVFVTGDIKYHEAQEAIDLGVSLIDATHFATENIMSKVLAKNIKKNFKDVCVYESGSITNPFSSL